MTCTICGGRGRSNALQLKETLANTIMLQNCRKHFSTSIKEARIHLIVVRANTNLS